MCLNIKQYITAALLVIMPTYTLGATIGWVDWGSMSDKGVKK